VVQKGRGVPSDQNIGEFVKNTDNQLFHFFVITVTFIWRIYKMKLNWGTEFTDCENDNHKL